MKTEPPRVSKRSARASWAPEARASDTIFRMGQAIPPCPAPKSVDRNVSKDRIDRLWTPRLHDCRLLKLNKRCKNG